MKLNGCLMTKDMVVAEVKNGEFIPINNELLPLYLNRVHNIEQWLIDRAIDGHRMNSRLLKKALRLTNAEDIELVLKVNAATITDTYWFKPDGSNLCYEDVRFKENMFDKLALYGDPDSFNHEYANTPELTNTGSFEKCWKRLDGEWWMYKKGNENELFSELFVCEFGKALGFNMAHYEHDGKYIKSLDFTNGAKVNYESAYSIVDTNEDYLLNFETFQKISEKCAKEYLAIIFVDTLCFNMDRHTQNYGILRDISTGEVLGLAPNFDNNIALISRGYPKNIERKDDRLINSFMELFQNNKDALEYFVSMQYPMIDKALVERCLNKVPIAVDREFVCSFILNANDQINERLDLYTGETKSCLSNKQDDEFGMKL